ncbi:MAG: class I SAM-dependent rRNA methyltransferase [Planctomycetaceae bacterium]
MTVARGEVKRSHQRAVSLGHFVAEMNRFHFVTSLEFFMNTLPQVVIRPRRALPFFSKHPWVFAGAIASVKGSPAAGDEVAVVTDRGEFIARGLYNPESNIRVRLYVWDKETPLDRAFWSARLDAAIALRSQILGTSPPRDCRVVYSESDGLSGLTVDAYQDWLLVQWTSRGLSTHRETLLDLLREKLQPRGIWLRTERGIGELEGLDVEDGLVWGEAPPQPILISENGLQFHVDVVEGQKTGYYFDQRDNRMAVARLAKGLRVLDAHCYSGSFGITAVKQGGAREAVCVDSSVGALELAAKNAEQNGVAGQIQFRKGDVPHVLNDMIEKQEQFDVVILDPPKMARTRGGLDRAAKAYLKLNVSAIRLIPPGGFLVSCSCSGLVDQNMFEEILSKAALDAGRTMQFLEMRGQSWDHPVSAHCRETAYLKCVIARVV